MPEKQKIEKAQKAKRAGKAPKIQAGEFARDGVHKIRRGERGARSPQPRERSTPSRTALSRVRAAAQPVVSARTTLDEYRRNASDCVEMARRVADREKKEVLVLIAQAWIKLAEQNAALRNSRVAV
jgi:hypothetical protein